MTQLENTTPTEKIEDAIEQLVKYGTDDDNHANALYHLREALKSVNAMIDDVIADATRDTVFTMDVFDLARPIGGGEFYHMRNSAHACETAAVRAAESLIGAGDWEDVFNSPLGKTRSMRCGNWIAYVGPLCQIGASA